MVSQVIFLFITQPADNVRLTPSPAGSVNDLQTCNFNTPDEESPHMRRMSEKRGYKQLDVSSSEPATKAADKVICSIGFGSFVRYAFVQLNVKILHLRGPTQIYIYIY